MCISRKMEKHMFLEEALLTYQLEISVHLKKMPLMTEAMNVLATD
jgi:hypothetical protein